MKRPPVAIALSLLGSTLLLGLAATALLLWPPAAHAAAGAAAPGGFDASWVFIGLAEGIAIYGLIVSILMLNRLGG